MRQVLDSSLQLTRTELQEAGWLPGFFALELPFVKELHRFARQ